MKHMETHTVVMSIRILDVRTLCHFSFYLHTFSAMVGTVEAQLKRVQKYDRSHAEIIYRVRQYFEREKAAGKSFNLNQVQTRTAEATGGRRNVISRIKTEADVLNWKYQGGDQVTFNRDDILPPTFSIIVGQTIRDLFSEKKELPTLNNILNRITMIRVADVLHSNLYEGNQISEDHELVWPWR